MNVSEKWREYKEITWKNITYVTFWKKIVLEKMYFEEILKYPFKHWWDTRSWTWEITNAWKKAKANWFKHSYTCYWNRLNDNTLELKRR
jgi:hypothetical protein